MSDLKWQVKVLRELLQESERRLNEQEGQSNMPFQLWGPCIAETRGGDNVIAWRVGNVGNCFCYQLAGISFPVRQNGHFAGNIKVREDIVKVVRPLTEKEILDFQTRGIKPTLD